MLQLLKFQRIIALERLHMVDSGMMQGPPCVFHLRLLFDRLDTDPASGSSLSVTVKHVLVDGVSFRLSQGRRIPGGNASYLFCHYVMNYDFSGGMGPVWLNYCSVAYQPQGGIRFSVVLSPGGCALILSLSRMVSISNAQVDSLWWRESHRWQ